MTGPALNTDPLHAIPDPDTLRVQLADAIRRRDLLRVAVRKASYPRPAAPVTPDAEEVSHVG